MNIVAYGGGLNSTAMLIGMNRHGIPVDLILFADTGCEQSHTYAYLPIMNKWLTSHGMPEIQVVEYVDHNGDRLTLEQEGLPLPGKSSCFFCPAMKRHEIRTLYHQHRDLYERAIAIERNAMPNLTSVKGLGRSWPWEEFVEADKNQTAMCWMFPESDMPCGCYDGE